MISRTTAPDGIAVLGVGCRFPGDVDSPSSYWRLLLDGRSAIAGLPQDRFLGDAVYDPDKAAIGVSYSQWGGFLADVAGFDHGFFEISPREAEAMDPQQRLLLMVVYEAMERAGLTRAALQRARTGVFAGASVSEYANLQRYQRTQGDAYTGTGAALSIIANRISHRYNLTGPSLVVDTACSSSLVALDQAVKSLAAGDCDLAIVAGASVLADFGGFVAFSKANMLSPTGLLAAFDARANGYVRGEGVGVVILKRAADAAADGDRVLARILATEVNQDGRTNTLTAPNPKAQRRMLERLCIRAQVDPYRVDYVEAHGTGTPVGDPIEAAAIGQVFGGDQRDGPLLMGSVKPNIGHLEPAAGIAGLIKGLLVAQHRQVPPNINFVEPNPDIAFEALNITVPTAATAIGAAARPVLIAVNSFGFGGTNASVLLESVEREAAAAATTAQVDRPFVVPISAGSPAALVRLAAATADTVEERAVGLVEAAASLARRDPKSLRKGLVAQSVEDLATQLRTPEVLQTARQRVASEPRLAFTYGGQGGQWWAMGRRLLVESRAFAEAFDAFEQQFHQLAGWSVRETMLADRDSSQLHRSKYAMPALFGLQLGLTQHWLEQGVCPDMVLGHSFGEVAAAAAAGAIGLGDATRLIHVRSQIRDRLGRDSAMLAIGIPHDELESIVPDGLAIDLAAINSPAMITVSGETSDIEALERRLGAEHQDLFARRVQSDTAWHSRLLSDLEPWFREALGEVAWQTPNCPFVSTVTGQPETQLDAEYWWQNLRRPVRYADAVGEALSLGANILLELSPHRVLTPSNSAIAGETKSSARAVASLVRDQDDLVCLAEASGALFEAGLTLQGPEPARPTDLELPNYAWDLTRHWRVSEEARRLLLAAPQHHLLGRREPGPGYIWSNEFDLAGYSMLADHAIGDAAVFPAAGYIELMLSAGREALGAGILELEHFEIASALFIGTGDRLLVSTDYDPHTAIVSVHTRLRDGSSNWTLRAKALIRVTDVAPAGALVTDLAGDVYGAQRFYAETSRLGFRYGRAFQGVTVVTVAGACATARIQLPTGLGNPVRRYLAHPTLVDAGLQTGLALGFKAAEEAGMFLPTTIERLRLATDLPPELLVTVVGRPSDRVDEVQADLVLGTPDGQVLMSLEGIGLRRAAPARTSGNLGKTGPDLLQQEFVRSEGIRLTAPPHSYWVVARDDQTEPVPGQEMVRLTELEKRLAGARDEAALHLVFVADPPPGASVAGSMRRFVHALIELGQVLRRSDRRLNLTVVTRGARAIAGDPRMNESGLAASALVGLVRTLAAELSHVRVRQVDLGREDGSEAAIGLSPDAGDTEFVVRGDEVWIPRLRTVPPDELQPPETLVQPGTANFALTMTAPGALAALHHAALDIPTPGPGEVLIRTAAVGLNFRDVMAATGLLPSKAEKLPAWQNLGLEFSGTVEALGEGVTTLSAGDRVFGMGKGAMRAFSCRAVRGLVSLPEAIDAEAGAAIGSAFATACYALEHVGRLRPGERVLIHLGTGGVGLAAIQIAQACGAEVFATAGSDLKRRYLRDLGVAHVMDSRSLAFADEIMTITGGAGVDVVLNSLSGSAQLRSLAVLKPFGRFLEIGKRDVYENRPVGLEALARNISLHVIDLAAMGEERPDLLAAVLADVMAGFRAGRFRPLPVTVFPAAAVQDAFRLMSQARHIGKVVISYGEPVPVRAPARRGFTASAQESYLVTGASSGFGGAVAAWLAEKGAGTVLLASRSGHMPADVNGEAYPDTRLVPVSLDVSDPAAVHALFRRLQQDGTRLGGVIHAATTYRDGLLEQLSPDDIDTVLDAKSIGAWNLHDALQAHGFNPRVFCSFSSIAETIGSIGQANYVAANAFLEGLTHYRRGLGLPAQCIAWGPLGDTGVVARSDAMRSYLASVGLEPLGTVAALEALDLLLSREVTSLIVANANWSRVGRDSEGRLVPRFASLVGEDVGGGGQLWAELLATPDEHWLPVVGRMLKAEIARVLKVQPDEIETGRSLLELGFDSLSSIELKNRIETQIGHALPIALFVGAPTLARLAGLVVDVLHEQSRSTTKVPGIEGEAAPQPDSDLELDRRRDRAYWQARFDSWPEALAFPGRRHPIRPRLGPLRRGSIAQLTVAYEGRSSEADWLLAFAQALCGLHDRQRIVLACYAGGTTIPVTVAATDGHEALHRQLDLARRHLGLDLGSLSGILRDEIETAKAWPEQVGFAFQQSRSARCPHDVLLEVLEDRIVLSVDTDALGGEGALQLLRRLMEQVPVVFDATIRQDEGSQPEGVGIGTKRLDLPAQAAHLLQVIESEGATDAFRRAWTLSQAIRIAPSVDIRRLQRAARMVEARHESLRTRFVGAPGRQKMLIRARGKTRVILHDCTGTSESEVLSVVRQLAKEPILPAARELFQLHLLRFNGLDVVLIKLFELVADGWSLAIVCDELLRAYLGLELGPAPVDIATAMKAIHHEAASSPCDETLATAPATLGRVARGLPVGQLGQLGEPDELVIAVDATGRKGLRTLAGQLGTTENALIAAAYVMALTEAGCVNELALHIIQPGRESPELRQFVGFLRRSHTLVTRNVRECGLAGVARFLSDRFLETADQGGGGTSAGAGGVSCPEEASHHRQFGYARLLPDQALASNLMGALAEYRNVEIRAFSLDIEAFDLGTFGLQENELHLRPLSRGNGLELHFHFDRQAFETREVAAIARAMLALLEVNEDLAPIEWESV